jgi:hypothetical protein
MIITMDMIFYLPLQARVLAVVEVPYMFQIGVELA